MTLHGRFPDKNRHALSKGHCQVRAPLTRRIRFASSGDALGAQRHVSTLGHSAPSGLPRRQTLLASPNSRMSADSKPTHLLRIPPSSPSENSGLRTPVSGPRSRPLGMVEHFWWTRLPHTETSLASLPHPLRSQGLSQSRRVDVEHPLSRTSPIGTGVAAFLRNRPGPSIPSTSPAPSIQGKADSSRKTIRPHAWVRASIKTPPFIPTKGTAQQPIPSTPPPTIK